MSPPITDSIQQVVKEHNYFDLSAHTSLCLSHHSNDNLNLKATELRLGLPGSQSPPRDEKPLFPFTPALSSSHKKRSYSLTIHKHPQDQSNAPAPKAQVVGWPPIPSFRKNTLSTTPNNTDPLFVKVSMDGAPYLRKVDLTTYSTYQHLSSALQNMFTCFSLGQCGRENLSETKLKDLLNGSEYVVTYEDKDGDWMLVGDVPWEMFIDTCKRLKIMKSCDAIGLAPRGMEKSKTQK